MKQAQILLLLLLTGFLGRSAAQTFDASGDGLLNGSYYFRQVFYVLDSSGNLTNAITLYGGINFDGKGNYTISGDKVDASTAPNNGTPTPVSYTASGTYTISASGMGNLSNSLYQGDQIYGLVSKGIFIGSTTETTQSYNDLFIAAPIGSTPATNSTFNGTYSVAYADGWKSFDTTFAFNANGAGSMGTVSASGFGLDPTNGPFPIAQNYSGTHYNFSDGGANVTFGGNGSVLPTGVLLYISPDGNFVFGGTFNGFDMYAGVRLTSGGTTFSGLYYEAGMDFDSSSFDTYYGAVDAPPAVPNVGQSGPCPASGSTSCTTYTLEHRRISGADYTFADPYALSNSTYDDLDTSQHYIFGLNGAIRIGFGTSENGNSPLLGFSVAIQAPSFSGSGVYLNPTGVVNAASSAPFTAGVSPGELVTLYGTGLAPGTAAAQSIPLLTTLDGVSVQINGTPAPILAVSPTQISVIVPYEISGGANFQVINNGVASNTVSEFLNSTSPGVFTNPEGGIGQAAALHSNYSLISPSSPAQIGETIQVFLTGLGTVSPAVSDGAAGASSEPLNRATNQITAYIEGTQATVTYAGLAPGFAGLYQVNLTIPSSISSGNVNLEIAGPDADTSESLIQIGTAAAAAVQPASSAQTRSVLRPAGRSRKIRGSALPKSAR